MKLFRRSAAALALMFVPIAPGPVMDTDGKVPDLKIEIVGFKDQNNQRDVVIRVTNVSQSWSTETQATVVTVGPGAANKLELRVPDLDPNWAPKPQGETDYKFEFTYTLAEPCNGHTIKATLSTGKDWEGDPEKNLANNTAQKQLCSEQAQATPTPTATSKPAPTSTPTPRPTPTATMDPVQLAPTNASTIRSGPIRRPAEATQGAILLATEAALAATPVYARPGEHTLEFGPSALSTRVQDKVSAIPDADLHAPGRALVGWLQVELDSFVFNDYDVVVAQTAVDFDLNTLDQLPKKTIKSAVLTYTETPVAWRNAYLDFEDKGGCVEVLGRATEAWAGLLGADTLFPNEQILRHTPGVTEWTVTESVEFWLNNTKPRLGFVLRGGNEDPQGEDNTSCLSSINDIKLTIRYEVPK
jgi:hypothetical protein